MKISWKNKAAELRESVLRVTTNAGRGHVTSCFSCVELLEHLYYSGVFKYDIRNPDWDKRDYFILSKGHADALLYAILADIGFINKDDFNRYCLEGSKIGPLCRGDLPGVEISSGSLGCGLGIAVGVAMSLTYDKMSNKVWCMLGDAECHEGSVWEAAYLAENKQLDNLIVLVDGNHMGATHFIEDEEQFLMESKWKSFGFDTMHIDGHSHNEVQKALEWAHSNNKCSAIIADTVKGMGVPFLEGKPLMHGVAVSIKNLDEAIYDVHREEIS